MDGIDKLRLHHDAVIGNGREGTQHLHLGHTNPLTKRTHGNRNIVITWQGAISFIPHPKAGRQTKLKLTQVVQPLVIAHLLLQNSHTNVTGIGKSLGKGQGFPF